MSLSRKPNSEYYTMSTWKRFKHGYLRHIPGSIGRKSAEKYNRRFATRRFTEVLYKTRGMLAIDLGANVGEYPCF